MLSALRLDCAAETTRIVAFIRQQMEAAGLRRAVIGLSGGVDSALVAALCAQALGPDQVRAVLLPYRTSNPDSEAHGRLVAEALGLDVQRFDISGMVDAIVAQQPDMSSGRKGNIMSRCRMVYLYDQSAACNGLVVGTSNRTETLLGYFTLCGDAPLPSSLSCTSTSARCVSSRLTWGCRSVIDKVPSADLWAGQTDEGELGFTYDEADQVLYLLTEEHRSIGEIAAQGFEADTVHAIEARMRRNAFATAGCRTADAKGKLPMTVISDGLLVLEDGSVFRGRSLAAQGEWVGEVVFNTAVAGYQEVLTDPSYWGQMVCFTYPHLGNVGVNPADDESGRVHVRAVISRQISLRPSNWRATMALPEYLLAQGVPALDGIDTRRLTLTLRERGVMRAALSTISADVPRLLEMARQAPQMSMLNPIPLVSRQRPEVWEEPAEERWVRFTSMAGQAAGGAPHVVAMDCGVKANILRTLVSAGARVTAVPHDTPAEQVLALQPDGLLIGNGPGDPEQAARRSLRAAS